MAGFTLGSDSLAVTPAAGQIEYNATSLYFTPTGTQRGVVTSRQMFILNTAYAGTNATGSQSIFGLTNGVTLAANTQYAFESVFAMSRTAGSTSHTISTGFGGTATLNSISYLNMNQGQATSFATVAALYDLFLQSASQTAVTGSISSTSLYINFYLKGIVSINAGGTFLPQYSLSAAPGGAYTTAVGSYFTIYPVATGTANVSIGTWS